MSELVVGIDIGANGGFAMLYDGQLTYQKLVSPHIWIKVIKKYKGKPDVVVIEDLHSIFGASAKSNFQFGLNNGIIIGALESSLFPYVKVYPKTWQKHIWIEEDKVYNGTKIDTKATSLNAALRIFPNENFLISSRSKVPHDGLVDASLLAKYGYDCCL